jgi:hypothetical protein
MKGYKIEHASVDFRVGMDTEGYYDKLPLLTPDEFKEEMALLEVAFRDDAETKHEKMDMLMEATLRKLGYGDGVDIFNEAYKWYC